MAVKIFDGVIERTSNATVTGGSFTRYEFIQIDGERIRDVSCGNYLDSFIVPGNKIRMACEKGIGAPYKVVAIQEDDGTISKVDLSATVIVAFIAFGFSLVLFAVPAVLAFALWGAFVGGLTIIGGPVALTYIATKDRFKARNALDS